MSSGDRQTVLVTGASGFVGSTLLQLASSYRCIALVRRESVRSPDASHTRLIEERSIDAWTEDALYQALADVDAVVHTASVVHRPGAPDQEYVTFNVDGTRALRNAARRRKVGRFVHLSSIKVYGENPIGVMDERTPTDPEGAYARTKLDAERLLIEASKEDGMSTTILRLCPVFGVGDKGNVRTMIRAIARGRFAVPGNGATRKSLVHVSTVCDGIIAALDKSYHGTLVIADNQAPTMKALAGSIARALGKRTPPRIPARAMIAAGSLVHGVAGLLGKNTAISAELIRKSLIETVCSPGLAERSLGIICHRDLDAVIDEEVAWLRDSENLGKR